MEQVTAVLCSSVHIGWILTRVISFVLYLTTTRFKLQGSRTDLWFGDSKAHFRVIAASSRPAVAARLTHVRRIDSSRCVAANRLIIRKIQLALHLLRRASRRPFLQNPFVGLISVVAISWRILMLEENPDRDP